VAEADAFNKDDTRTAYDTVARRYSDAIAGELENKPFDREFLDRFAELVKDGGHVVELGAGPAHVAAYLAERGVDISALDLSAQMVDEAKRLFPGLQAVVGDMLDLPYANGSLGGVIAFYSIIHFDDVQLASAFKEMSRVVRTGGYVALAFHVGDEVVHRAQWWDMPVVLDSRFLPVELVTKLLGKAGLEVVSVEEREPYAPEVEYQSRRAYIVAREPQHV
jgi:SAM-dependent methyltransferase